MNNFIPNLYCLQWSVHFSKTNQRILINREEKVSFEIDVTEVKDGEYDVDIKEIN